MNKLFYLLFFNLHSALSLPTDTIFGLAVKVPPSVVKEPGLAGSTADGRGGGGGGGTIWKATISEQQIAPESDEPDSNRLRRVSKEEVDSHMTTALSRAEDMLNHNRRPADRETDELSILSDLLGSTENVIYPISLGDDDRHDLRPAGSRTEDTPGLKLNRIHRPGQGYPPSRPELRLNRMLLNQIDLWNHQSLLQLDDQLRQAVGLVNRNSGSARKTLRKRNNVEDIIAMTIIDVQHHIVNTETAIRNFDNDPPGLLEAVRDTLQSLQRGTGVLSGLPRLGLLGAINIQIYAFSLLNALGNALEAAIDIRPSFDNAGVTPVLVDLLGRLRTEANTLALTLGEKVPVYLAPVAALDAQVIDLKFQKTLAQYADVAPA